ncbi:MAG: alpha-ketoglutarate-dependent dioxygenase AlkB [Thermodesulfobacteriota bacterium]
MRAPEQRGLFEQGDDRERARDDARGLPDGLVYRPGFLTPEEEQALLAQIRALPLAEARYKDFTAKRRIVSFGASYDFTTNAPLPAPPLPRFLHSLRSRLAGWSGVDAGELEQCTVAEYAPGTQLGWHRDVPTFGVVLGVSLGSPARMGLRPYPHRKHTGERSLVLVLEPRSAYVIRDEARWRWQHAISPTKALRYSITFRTMLGGRPS